VLSMTVAPCARSEAIVSLMIASISGLTAGS
jgi:hypothetical protein